MIAVDESSSTQKEVAEAVASSLGNGSTAVVPREEVLMTSGLALQLIDMPLQGTPLPGTEDSPLQLSFTDGLLANLEAVKREFLKVRRITPLRILMAGAPCSGEEGNQFHVLTLQFNALRSSLNRWDKKPQDNFLVQLRRAVRRSSTWCSIHGYYFI